MADFSVLIYTLENKSSSLNDYKKKLKSYSSKVQSIKNSMPLNGDVGIQIKKAMKESSENLRVLSETASSFSSVLKDVGNKYWYAECDYTPWNRNDTIKLLGFVACVVNPGLAPVAYWKAGNYFFENAEPGDYLSLAGNFGKGGSIVSIIGNLINGKNDPKSYISAADKFVSSVIDDEPITDLKTLFGYSNAESTKGFTKSIKKSIKDKISDHTFIKAKGNAKTAEVVKHNSKVKAKWAGHAVSTLFTVATKAYDNFVNPQGEDKYNSTGRKVAETITESAVDIAVDAGIKAGVTVAATALLGATPVGWAAVGVGVAAVGVKWVADQAFKHFTGKDMTEYISDGIIDGAKNVFNNVGNAVQTGLKNIGGWWNNLTKPEKKSFAY